MLEDDDNSFHRVKYTQKKLKRKYQESSIDGSDQKRGTGATQIISQRHIVIIQR